MAGRIVSYQVASSYVISFLAADTRGRAQTERVGILATNCTNRLQYVIQSVIVYYKGVDTNGHNFNNKDR